MILKTCNKCRKKIGQKSVTVEGKPYHPECIVCNECKKKIKGSFNIKDSRFYHNECYQKKFRMFCAACRKALDEKWIVNKGLKYHENCYEKYAQLKCGICSKPIEGQYNYDEDGSYHPECFKQEKVPKCNVCLIPLEGEYIIDIWGNKSHKEHNGKKPDFCDACSRILSENTTKGFITHKDLRKICGICQKTEIIQTHQIPTLKIKVIEELKAVGLNYIPSFIKVDLSDKNTINKLLGSSITENTHGYTKTVFSRTNGIVTSKQHSITMLYGLPKLVFEGVLAHEFLHVWLNEKGIDMPAQETEGFCNLGTALIYKNNNSEFGNILLEKLDKDSNSVYGNGYRLMKEKLEKLGWDGLINDVLNYKPKLVNKIVKIKGKDY